MGSLYLFQKWSKNHENHSLLVFNYFGIFKIIPVFIWIILSASLFVILLIQSETELAGVRVNCFDTCLTCVKSVFINWFIFFCFTISHRLFCFFSRKTQNITTRLSPISHSLAHLSHPNPSWSYLFPGLSSSCRCYSRRVSTPPPPISPATIQTPAPPVTIQWV